MGMTKKNYIKIAAIISRVEDMTMRRRLCREFAEICAADNCNFNINIFETACKIYAPAADIRSPIHRRIVHDDQPQRPERSRIEVHRYGNDSVSSPVRNDRVFSVNHVRISRY